MPNYRRAFVPGGCWFFTVNLLERHDSLLVDHIAGLREAVAATRETHDFEIDAFECRAGTATAGLKEFLHPPLGLRPNWLWPSTLR